MTQKKTFQFETPSEKSGVGLARFWFRCALPGLSVCFFAAGTLLADEVQPAPAPDDSEPAAKMEVQAAEKAPALPQISSEEFSSRLTAAIQLVRAGTYESALEELKKLEHFLPSADASSSEKFTQTADYWFYRAVAEHQMFLKEDCLKSLKKLEQLEESSETHTLPARFLALVSLMRNDLENLSDKSLEMISRRMKSVEKRLEAGAAGEKVQNSEEEIVKMLDSAIEELEQKAQKQKVSRSSKSLKPGKKPMEQARPAGGNGPGKVTRKELKFDKDWGKLPEKEREEILQSLGRDFPPHYRDAIEQYFKRIAEEE